MSDPTPSVDHQDLSIVIVSGNPRAESRTLAAAAQVAVLLSDVVGVPTSLQQIDLATVADRIFGDDRSDIDVHLKTLAEADLAIIATPVYKASFTGLLKSFLDLYPSAPLDGVVAVPLVVSASPAHSLVGETSLRPLLVELGATVPTRALALVENQLGRVDEAATDWITAATPALRAALRLGSTR